MTSSGLSISGKAATVSARMASEDDMTGSYSVLVIDWDKIEANHDVVFQRVVIAGTPFELGIPIRLKRGENIRVEWWEVVRDSSSHHDGKATSGPAQDEVNP